MRPVGRFENVGREEPCDRQFRVRLPDVCNRFCFEVEDGRILGGVRNLDHPGASPIFDEECLVAFAPEVGRSACNSEEIGGDLRDLVWREVRRRRLENVGRLQGAPGKNRTCARGLGNRCSIH